MQLHTTLSRVGGSAVLSLDGTVDLSTVAVLHAALVDAIRRHPATTVIVDLDGASALDDTALGVLLGAAATARDADGDLSVVSSDVKRRDRLARTRFDRAVDVRSSIS